MPTNVVASSLPLAPRRWLRLGAFVGCTVFLAVLGVFLTDAKLGMALLWNAIVPVLPLLVLLFPNLWTSVCPLANAQRLPTRLGIASRQPRRLTRGVQERLELTGIGLLLVLVPLRHSVFDVHPMVDLVVLCVLPFLAFGAGMFTLGLSGWCGGACPVQPVEALYGLFSLERTRPETCRECRYCQQGCRRLDVRAGARRMAGRPALRAFAYGFPGFVLGWFLCDPQAPVLVPFALCWGYALVSALLGFACEGLGAGRVAILRGAALSAITIYYAYRVPGLVQFWFAS